MPKKTSRNAAPKQHDRRTISPALQSGGPKSRKVDQPALTGWRRWAGRLALMLLVPAVLLGALEMGLRLFGYGYPTSFFQKMEDGLNYTANRCFGWQFFPKETS